MLNRGFTLIEVLVTLVILTFGLLGIAGLMAKGQRASFEAFERQQAVALGSDMAERVRANRTQAAVYGTAIRSGGHVGGEGNQYDDLLHGGVKNCGTFNCTPAEIAAYDVALWDGMLTGYSEAVISGGAKVGGIVNARGCIDETANTLGTCPASYWYTRSLRISVAWQGNEDTVAPTVSACGQGAVPSGNQAPRRRDRPDGNAKMPMTRLPLCHLSAARAVAQRGLSLIEMMIGLTIGLMLTLGLFTLIANTSQSFKVQDDFSRMQENGATAFRYIGDSLRHAGFFGNTVVTDNIKIIAGNSNVVDATSPSCGSGANPPDTNWAFDFSHPLIAFPDLTPASVGSTFPCISAQNFYAGPVTPGGNPVLVTRGANGYRICNALVAAPGPPVCTNPNSLLAAQPDPANTVYVQATPYAGWVFYGRDYSTAKGKKYLVNGLDANELEMFEYRAHIYYVWPCSRPAGGGANCTGAADDNGNPIPTLVRQELVGSSMVEVPLAEGIEWIDYRFGVDENGDGVADSFKASPVATDWLNVVTVKVSILVRSPNVNLAYDDKDKQYDLYGDGVTRVFRCTAQPAPACRYKRKVFSQIFQVRNVAQRKGA